MALGEVGLDLMETRVSIQSQEHFLNYFLSRYWNLNLTKQNDSSEGETFTILEENCIQKSIVDC